ncbi:MAG: tyrosine-type recombinase/integrase [Burkholderiales bacterium]
MAKPYQEGKTWSIRLRIQGQDVYLSGFTSAASALKAATKQRQALENLGKPIGLGPRRTSVGQALQTYACERLPFLKGARQDANRINRYLRSLGLDLLRLKQPDSGSGDTPKTAYWIVELAPCPLKRTVPQGLHVHREQQQRRTLNSDWHRAKLARTPMSEVTPHQLQSLIDAMRLDGYEAATIALERAGLRSLFNHAQRIWSWPEPSRNPASGLVLPKVDNARDRVLSNSEWDRLIDALQVSVNRFIMPALALLLQTTMRSSEILLTARWQDVDWDRCILKLGDAKAGARNVPLNPGAIAVLRQLKDRTNGVDPQTRIFPISYESLKAAWTRACERAGIENANLHDLRHTGTTRFALEYHGNLPVLKLITGHKTDVQLQRYINIKVDDVVRMMHGRPLSEDDAPAGLTAARLAEIFKGEAAVMAVSGTESLPANVVRFDVKWRSA